MKRKFLRPLILLAAISMTALHANFIMPLAEPITLEAPVIEELELVSVRIFPGQKRIEIVAKAGDETIVAAKTGAAYDAIIAQIDVGMLTAVFLPQLRAAAAAKLQAPNPAVTPLPTANP